MRQFLREPAHVALGNPRRELGAGVGVHVLVNPQEALGQDAHVVIAVHVLPDVLDDFRERERRFARRLDVEAGDVSEILDERAVEAVEHDELGLVDVGAKARAASEHLLPQDARLHRAQEHDELQRRDVHAGREHVHGDDDLGIGAVAELADALERAVHVRVAGDLLHEVVALIENVAAGFDELVGVRGVREIVDGEDEDFRESGPWPPRVRRRIWRLPR